MCIVRSQSVSTCTSYVRAHQCSLSVLWATTGFSWAIFFPSSYHSFLHVRWIGGNNRLFTCENAQSLTFPTDAESVPIWQDGENEFVQLVRTPVPHSFHNCSRLQCTKNAHSTLYRTIWGLKLNAVLTNASLSTHGFTLVIIQLVFVHHSRFSKFSFTFVCVCSDAAVVAAIWLYYLNINCRSAIKSTNFSLLVS